MRFFLILVIIYMFVQFAHAAPSCESYTTTKEVQTTKQVSDTPPKGLEDAAISVHTKNGKIYVFNSNEWKVVRRQKEVTVSKLIEETIENCTPDTPKNRVSVLVGKGPQDSLDKSQPNANQVNVSTTSGEVLGIQNQRNLFGNFSLGVQTQSNKTNSLMLGFDF